MSLMCSWTPKISCTTRTIGNGPPDTGIARYAGIWPLVTGIFTSPASSPLLSVVTAVWAEMGWAARANPDASEVTTNPRLVKSTPGSKLCRSSFIGRSPSSSGGGSETPDPRTETGDGEHSFSGSVMVGQSGPAADLGLGRLEATGRWPCVWWRRSALLLSSNAARSVMIASCPGPSEGLSAGLEFETGSEKNPELTFPTKVLSDSLGRIGRLKRTSDKSLFPMALGSCGHRITHQLRPINMNGRSILAVTSELV